MSLLQRSQFGHRLGTTVGGVFTPAPASAPTVAALKAVDARDRVHGDEVVIDGQNSRWKFNSTSTLVDDGGALVIAPSAGTGVWLRMAGDTDIALPFTFATADAAVLLTLQAGMMFILRYAYWKVTTTFAGGASSASTPSRTCARRCSRRRTRSASTASPRRSRPASARSTSSATSCTSRCNPGPSPR